MPPPVKDWWLKSIVNWLLVYLQHLPWQVAFVWAELAFFVHWATLGVA